jgi:hypothetical protein
MLYPVLADVELEEHLLPVVSWSCGHNVSWHEGCLLDRAATVVLRSMESLKIEILERWIDTGVTRLVRKAKR